MQDLPVDPTLPRHDADFLVDWLAHRDTPCPACGYNLRGLVGPTCPECGRGLRLGVSLSEQVLGAWIATLVALLLPAGFGLYLMVVWSVMFLKNGVRVLSMPPTQLALIAIYLLASVPLSIALIFGRRRFLRWSAAVQLACGGLAWTFLLIAIVMTVDFIQSL